MCLTLGVTILSSTTERQLLLYSQCTVGALVWSAKVSAKLHIDLFLLKALKINLVYLPVESEYTTGCICTL